MSQSTMYSGATWMRPLHLRGRVEGACGHSSQPPLSHPGCLIMNIIKLRNSEKLRDSLKRKISFHQQGLTLKLQKLRKVVVSNLF